jgi:hypothetical protein
MNHDLTSLWGSRAPFTIHDLTPLPLPGRVHDS